MMRTHAMRWVQACGRLLPALIPSWRFFDAIGPSPRVEWRWRAAAEAVPGPWREFAPRPAMLPVREMLLRMLWNPAWNEALYVMRCAERVLEGDTGFPLRELAQRVRDALEEEPALPATACCEFRILAHVREGAQVAHGEVHRSPLLRRAAPAVP